MFKVIRRAWRYLVFALSGRLDELSDPRIQIEQAIQEAKEQHQRLSQQAAAVIGNERELQMKLTRSLEETERLQANARQAVLLAEQARAAGDERKALSYEDSARAFASRLVAAETALRDAQLMHERAGQSSAQARAAVETNAMALQKKIAERMRLLSQLDQAAMQEQLNRAMGDLSGLAPAGETPTMDQVRDKIEKRYARALGEAELTSGSVEARMIEVERAAIDVEGAARLEAIRESLALERKPDQGDRPGPTP
ncbi:PspA/IM30 family protein [Streptosporangium pseudovulgare]|uniref:35 kDa protein n=1 Tax=Streptosporangium pseudovulgare TaxID=35765 RepID=A0ABQ2QLI3_9ACTN|nr:PspA/IM30 family protein [Streptosporangium pseudovulgare]GGP87463.1 35 kDa protein [Streptosporangium pseudovulgare]